MLKNEPVLHLVCGKIAAGKSTLAQRLASEPLTILVCEDSWLSFLYPDELKSVPDYVKYSQRLRKAMENHIPPLLQSGLSVVMDFPANTLELRRGMRRIFEQAGVDHQLHFLDVPDAVCKERLRLRNKAGDHEFSPSEAEFDLISRYFVPPQEGEGFNVVVHQVP